MYEFVTRKNRFQLESTWYGDSVVYRLLSDVEDELVDITYHGESVHERLYFCFAEIDGQHIQPCTALGPDRVLYFWAKKSLGLFRACTSVVQHGDWGTDLREKYEILFDPGTVVDFYPSVNEFFGHAYGLNVYKKHEAPWQTTDRWVDPDQVVSEMSKFNPERIDLTPSWRVDQANPEQPVDHLQDSAVRLLVKQLGFTFVHRVSLSYLEPESVINPHRDLMEMKKIYVPLYDPEGVTYKFERAGNLPMEQGRAYLLDTRNFYHGVVNTSDRERTALMIYAS